MLKLRNVFLGAAIPLLTVACSDRPTEPTGVAPAPPSLAKTVGTVSITDIGDFNSTAPTAFDINDHGQVGVRSRWSDGTFHSYVWSERDGAFDIGHGGGGSTGVNAINDRGALTGWTTLPGRPSDQIPIVWTADGGFNFFLGDVPGRGFDINERGDVVGNVGFPNAAAFFWSEAGGIVYVAGSSTVPSGAFDIIKRGDVVGWTRTSGCCTERAFLWSAEGGLQILGTVGATGGNSFALSQNDKGMVVGTFEVAQATAGPRGGPGLPRSIPMHAFVWTEGDGMIDIGTLPGHTHSQAWAVDKHDRVFGWSRAASGNPSRAFMWTAETGMIDLGTLGGTMSSSGGINQHGQVAGWSTNAAGAQRAVVFQVR